VTTPLNEHELTTTETWFRDLLGRILGLGGAMIVLVSGWLLSNDTLFSLDQPAGTDKREAAVFLCVLLPVAWLLWYAAVLKTHSNCPVHPTVLRRPLVHLYCVGTGMVLLALIVMAVEAVG
jgi:hypothetical protein